MRHALADTNKHCYNPPPRPPERACERCKTPYCDDCLLAPLDGRRLCAQCALEEQAAEQLKPTWRSRLIGLAVSTRNAIIGVAVIAVVAGVLLYAFRDSFNRPITPEEMARFRYAIMGSFITEEGLNLNSTVLDAKVVSATSAAPDHPAKTLIDEYPLGGLPGWRSEAATFPQEIVVSWGDKGAPTKVILVNHPDEDPATYVRDFEVLVSAEGPASGFTSVGRFTMTQESELQRFEITPVSGLWAMLRILSNYGSRSYTSLVEFDAYVVPNDPTRASPTPTKSGR